MRKTAYIVWHDFYHPKDALEPLVERIFDETKWNVIKTQHLSDILKAETRPDLLMFYSAGKNADETPATMQEQEQVVHMVKQGTGVLFAHAGMVWGTLDCPFAKELNCGVFFSHPDRKGENLVHAEQCNVTTVPLAGGSHPVINGVEAFGGIDEHYFVGMDVSRTNLLACASSEHGVTVGVWAHSYGKGKVVCIAQGHTPEVVMNPNMITLQKNAIDWLCE